MAKENLILTKSYSFALDIIQLYSYLNGEKREYVISKQILRSGTSIGANAEEASAGISKKEFVAKFQISYKEANETHYWLRLLRDSKIVEEDRVINLLEKCDEIIRILNAILQSSKS